MLKSIYLLYIQEIARASYCRLNQGKKKRNDKLAIEKNNKNIFTSFMNTNL